MSMLDCMDEYVWCPDCKPKYNKLGKRIGAVLECSVDNYKGFGVDICNCERCGKGFQVSYKVDKIEHIPDWDLKEI